MRVLAVNAGSSSLKLRLLAADDATRAEADLPADGGRFDEAGLREALAGWEAPDAVGHRLVHGGERFRDAAVLDEAARHELEGLAELAPLHQAAGLAAARVVAEALPGVPAVACFDTAFHAALPAAAATYPLPAEWRERFRLRRYGFHGLSHAYAARRAGELGAGERVVTCHLGAGASLAAVRAGASVDTTMGFTPLEGLAMATRSGSVDPGLVLWLVREGGLDPAQVQDGLEHRSGLAGLAGTPDMREVVERDDPDARLAFDVYVHRLRAGIAAMAAALGGLDALAFTGGVGEHQPAVREAAAASLGFLGVELDPARNREAAGDAEVGAPGASVRAWVLTAREDLEIARQARVALGAGA